MKLIQVGLGSMGVHWTRVVADFDEIDCVAYVDIDTDRAKEIAEQGGLDIPVFVTLQEALENVETDAILDISPPHTRLEHIALALEHNLPVLLEKPLAPSMTEAYQIRDMVKTSPLPFVVTQNYRYSPALQTLKQALLQIGKIVSVNVQHYRGLTLPGFHRQLSYPFLQDMSIHHFDLMRFLFEKNPQTITAFSWNPPNSTFPGDSSVAVFLKFADDLHVNYHASWSSTGFLSDWNGNWRIEGDKGTIEMRDSVIGLQMLTHINSEERIAYDFTEVETIKALDAMPTGQHYLLDEFHRAVQGKRQAVTTVQDNIYSLGIVFSVIDAIQAGQKIDYHIKG